MNIRFELSTSAIAELIKESLEESNFDIAKIVDTKATQILQEIQNILAKEDLSDFEIVEEIVCIFEKHKLSTGGRHDFG